MPFFWQVLTVFWPDLDSTCLDLVPIADVRPALTYPRTVNGEVVRRIVSIFRLQTWSSDFQASMARSKFMLRFRISCTRVNKCVHVYRTIKSDTAEISVVYSLQTLTFCHKTMHNWPLKAPRVCVSICLLASNANPVSRSKEELVWNMCLKQATSKYLCVWEYVYQSNHVCGSYHSLEGLISINR